MKTKSQVVIEPVYVEFIPEDDQLEQGKFYISEVFSTSAHLCLCGCGGKSIVPFTVPKLGRPLDTKWWTLLKYDDGNIISISPSILNSGLDCKSHYVISRNVANIL